MKRRMRNQKMMTRMRFPTLTLTLTRKVWIMLKTESKDGKEGSAVKLWEKQNRQVEKASRLEEREDKARLREEKELRREEKERPQEGNDRVCGQKRFDADNLDDEQHLSKYGQTYDGITEGDIECQLEIAMADHQDYRDIWFPEWPEWDELWQERQKNWKK